tara:strand:+ start:267 stop:437 length:171 start_codon:yes stop_codon:yes gene_type:complete
MSRRTVQTQRKIKIPSGLKKRLEKAKAEKAIEKVVINPTVEEEDSSCCSQKTSCCG